MKVFGNALRCFLAVAAVAFSLGAASRAHAEDADERGTLVGSILIPTNLSATVVQSVCVDSFIGREWNVKSKSDGQVVGYLKHRHNEASLTLAFDSTKVELYCQGWHIDGVTGSRIKPELPENWLENMRHDLKQKLSKAAALSARK